MEENKNEGIGNIYTMLGGALLGVGIVQEITKTIIPAVQKLTSGEPIEQLKMLPSGMEKERKEEPREEHEKKDNEITELKRKLLELEQRQQQ